MILRRGYLPIRIHTRSCLLFSSPMFTPEATVFALLLSVRWIWQQFIEGLQYPFSKLMEWHRLVSMTVQVKLLLPFVRLVVLHVPPVASWALHFFSLALKVSIDSLVSDVISSLWANMVNRTMESFSWYKRRCILIVVLALRFSIVLVRCVHLEENGARWERLMSRYDQTPKSNSCRRGLLSEQIPTINLQNFCSTSHPSEVTSLSLTSCKRITRF